MNNRVEVAENIQFVKVSTDEIRVNLSQVALYLRRVDVLDYVFKANDVEGQIFLNVGGVTYLFNISIANYWLHRY